MLGLGVLGGVLDAIGEFVGKCDSLSFDHYVSLRGGNWAFSF